MEIKKRIAIVGLGSIGYRHARLLNERNNISVEFVEPNHEALARAKKEIGDLPAHSCFEDMLKTKPEIRKMTDMLLIILDHKLKWCILEVELASHSVYDLR